MGSVQGNFIKSRKFSFLGAVIFIIGVTSATTAHSAKLLWEGDFETGDLSQYKKKIYGEGVNGFVDVVTSPVRSGRYAVRSTVNGTDRKRAELLTDRPKLGKVRFFWDGPEYWIGASLFFNEWKFNGNTFLQLHAPVSDVPGCSWDGNGLTIRPRGDSSSDPSEDFFALSTIKSPSGISSGKGSSSNNIDLYKEKIVPGKWTDFVFRFKFSTQGKGYVEAWIDGKKVVSKFNLSNVNWKDSCGNLIPPERRRYNGVHIGLYVNKDAVDLGNRVMYFDEVRIAEGPDGYNLVSPPSGNKLSSAPAPTAPPTAAATAPPAAPTGLQ